MDQRALAAYSLKHSIKKGMFFILGKLNLFKWGSVGVLRLLPLLGYAPVFDIGIDAKEKGIYREENGCYIFPSF